MSKSLIDLLYNVKISYPVPNTFLIKSQEKSRGNLVFLCFFTYNNNIVILYYSYTYIIHFYIMYYIYQCSYNMV